MARKHPPHHHELDREAREVVVTDNTSDFNVSRFVKQLDTTLECRIVRTLFPFLANGKSLSIELVPIEFSAPYNAMEACARKVLASVGLKDDRVELSKTPAGKLHITVPNTSLVGEPMRQAILDKLAQAKQQADQLGI